MKNIFIILALILSASATAQDFNKDLASARTAYGAGNLEDARFAMQQMLTQFNKLYETGEFQLGYCVAHVTVNEQGTVDSVRVLRPQNVDKRVESAIVRSMKPRRYKPATACGRPVAFTMSVGVGHCPSRTERGRKPDVNK